jgi:Flp pilus assembly protein TadD
VAAACENLPATEESRMITPRTKRWSLVCGACLAVAAGLVLASRAISPKLPGESYYGNLPQAFNQALGNARGTVRRNDFDPEDLRALAHLYHANRLHEEARACYAIIAKGSKLTAHDHYYLADIAQYEGDLERARTELQAVAEAEPGYLPARLELGDVLFKSGRADEAAEEYGAILQLEPNQPQALFGLARIDLLKGDDAAAVARLEGLMASHPEMTSGAGLLAQVLDRRGDARRAAAMRQWSRQKPEPVPADPWMDALLADCYDVQRLGLKFEEYFASGQVALAVPLLDRVAELDPKSPIPELLRGWTQARDHHDLEAVQEYRKALEKGGDPEKLCPYMVQSMLALGKVDDAARLMAGYYAKKPDSIPILTAYAQVAVKQGDTNMVRVLLRKVLDKEPYDYSANFNLARVLWASGERDEAAACLGRIAEVKPSDIASRALLGEYYLGKPDPVAAIAPLEQAIAHESAPGPLHKNLEAMLYTAYVQAGNAAVEKGRLAEAVATYYEKAIALSPENPAAYADKAVASVQFKEWRGAAAALEKLASLQPRNPTVYLSLGDVQFQEGEGEQAHRNWRRALELAGAGDKDLTNAINARLTGPVTADTFR